jgi:hypothetical protein
MEIESANAVRQFCSKCGEATVHIVRLNGPPECLHCRNRAAQFEAVFSDFINHLERN